VLLAGGVLSAHRRDEYLQAARLAVMPDEVRVELDLTPGIAIADAVISRLDRDRNGAFSATEWQDYVSSLTGAMMLDVDGRPLHMQVDRSAFPTREALAGGEGTIRIEMRASMPMLPGGSHHVRFRNDNSRESTVYLANALVPESESVTITAQRRNTSQSELTIDFILNRPLTPLSSAWGTRLTAVSAFAVLLGWMWRARRRPFHWLPARQS
jgi:hypothetical protein